MKEKTIKLNKEDVEAIERIKANPSLNNNLGNRMISDIINYRCSDCNSAMEELEEDFEGMSDGQIADYEAGFSRTFYCPKCQSTSLRDVEVFAIEEEGIMPTPAQLESLEKGRRTVWNNKGIRGVIGEMWFANKLRNEGYKVRKTMHYDYETGVSIFNEKGVEDLLKEYPKKKQIMDLLISFGKGYPDLICLKDNKISFYEVKTNISEIKEHQKNVIKILQSKKYESQVIRLNVDFSVKEEENE